jgi:DNA-binding NtrC family response regulator/tetratricopeptide (TPR) repeat protein
MESPVGAFRRNLEPFEAEQTAGPWRFAGHGDPISERRYLVSWAALDPSVHGDAGIVAFRCESAVAIAPDACLPALEVSAAAGRVEILTPYAGPVAAPGMDDAAITATLEALGRLLEQFDAHAFHAAGLRPEFVGRDETGRFVLLPGAYAIPADAADNAREALPCAVRERARAAHVSGFATVAGALSSTASPALAARLGALHAAIADGTVTSASGAVAFVLGRTLPAPDVPGASAAEADLAPVIRAVESGQVAIVSGPPGSGRTTLLAGVREALRAAGIDAQCIDEWDGGAPARTRRAARDAAARGAVWLVDDIDERPLLHAMVLEHAGEMERRPGAGLVIATHPGDGDADPPIVAALAHRAPRGVVTVSLAPRGGATGAAPATTDPFAARMLELLAVAGIALPLDVLASVFPGSGRELHRHLHALCGAGVAEIESRRLPPGGAWTPVARVCSASLRRRIQEAIPEARRRSLHRTLAHVCEARGTFAPMFLYEHLSRAGDHAAAAAVAAAFVRESTRPQRAPFLDTLARDVAEGRATRDLACGDHLGLLVRLGDDLLARGRQADAESILTRAHRLRPGGGELRAHAALASEAVRLLADAWSARGRLRQALELLDEARDDIAPYLSLPEQARLLNDIGWLQYRLGDYSSCVDSCKFTINTLNANEHPLVVAQALNLLGVIAFNTSRYDEAVSYYEQAAFLREREHEHNALAGSYNNLALAYQAKGEYDKALEHLHRSIEIKRRQNNEAGLAGGYLNLAVLHLEVHNFDEAERRCRESLRISSALGLAQLVAENHNTLGDIVFTRGQLDEAESCYRRALEHARRLSTVNEEMGAQKRLARLYLRKGRHDAAREAIDEASRLARQVGSKYEQAQTEEISGDLRAAEGHHAEAIDRFEKAATQYATLSKYRMASSCFARAGLAQTQVGGTLEARRYLDRAQDLIKSQIGHEIPEEIITLQQALRERPRPAGPPGEASQKLLYAFYELSSLADYAEDRGAFFRRIVNVLGDLTGASACALALRTDEDRFATVTASGDQEPLEDPALRALLSRALQLGSVLHAETAEAGDLFAQVACPATSGARDERLVVVPMKSMGRDLGCALVTLPSAAVPRSKDDLNFVSCIARHVAGAMRLSLNLAERSRKEETLERELDELGAPAGDRMRFQNMIGRDEPMKKVFRIVDKIKDMDTGILIFGESGTGKTELARAIHYNSPRRRHLFQTIHCAEIPSSLLESELFGHERGAFTGAVQRKLGRCEIADGGTVFLDDVNVMPVDTQARLLHYLESKSFTRLGGTQKITTDVRLIAASNEDLERLVKEGRFREDLYYRLKVVQIELPPLRERPEDMILIAQEFLKKRCQAQGKALKRLSSETIKLFQKYRWPGNVRELQNVLEQIVLLCDDDIVEPSSLPEDFLKRSAGGGRQTRHSLEHLAQQMVESGGYSESNPLMPQIELLLASKMSSHTDNKTRAASLLGITKPTLYSRLRGYERIK